MQRVARLALTFLLAIALPLQGFAAATMVSCGLAQHGRSAAQTTAHSHELGGVAHHAAHADGDIDPAHADGHALGGKADLAKHGVHKCSACASCCTGAAMPSHVVVFAAVELADYFAPLVVRSMPAYESEGLERPPRSLLV